MLCSGLLAVLPSLDLRVEGLHQEVAAIAYHFHWSRDECMRMSRRERRVWLGEIGKINAEIAKAAKGPRGRR